jgi:trimeric autotransporter adhesin
MVSQNQNMLAILKNAGMIFFVFAGICFGQSTWVKRDPLPPGTNLSSVACGNGMFVAVGDSGWILTSFDGTTWTLKNPGTVNNLYSVTFGNSLFVAVGAAGTVLVSSDGATWTVKKSGLSLWLTSVTWGNGLFVAVG